MRASGQRPAPSGLRLLAQEVCHRLGGQGSGVDAAIERGGKRPVQQAIEQLKLEYFDDREAAGLSGFGNYRLDASRLCPDTVVYAVGVGRNTSFENALSDWGVHEIEMYDPTPSAAEHVERAEHREGQTFHRAAVYTHSGAVRLHFDGAADLAAVHNLSATDIFADRRSVSVPCRTLEGAMRENGHTEIGLLKLDIEGAAPQVLLQFLGLGHRPEQILCEFERPRRLREQVRYVLQLSAVFAQLNAAGYAIYETTDMDYKELEIAAVLRKGPQAQLALQ